MVLIWHMILWGLYSHSHPMERAPIGDALGLAGLLFLHLCQHSQCHNRWGMCWD